MFIIDLQYTAPLEALDAAMEAHVQFLDAGYASGHFIASGRKEPRTGGVILAKATGKEALEALLEQDPFKQKGLAVYTITEFIASKKAAAAYEMMS